MASIQKFAKFLDANEVPPDVQTYMMKAQPEGLGWKSISDFAGYFTDKDYEEGVQTDILANTGDKADKTARARLRVAWRLARAELKKVEDAVGGATEEMDWDAPLGEDDEKKRSEDFSGRYDGLKFRSGSTPAANVVARYFREFRGPKKQASIPPLKRMRSAEENPCEPSVKRSKLADNAELLQKGYKDLPDKYFATVPEVLMAVRLMTNAWALSGTTEVDSKVDYDQTQSKYNKVPQVHLSQAIHYHDFVYDKAMNHPGPEFATIAWILDRDRQTRSKARELFAEGWPYGEAIVKCLEMHCTVLWNLDNRGMATTQRAVGFDGDGADDEEGWAQQPQRKRPRNKKNFAQRQQQRQQQQQQQQPLQRSHTFPKGGKGSGARQPKGGKGAKQDQRPWNRR